MWIDSQTEEEIQRGIREAKPLSEYDNLSASAYLRAKEDYLIGINFSRVLSLKYGNAVKNYLKNSKWTAVSAGRVMTCVLGMVVKREREIRNFVKTPFYRVVGRFSHSGQEFEGEWRAVEGSGYFKSPLLYKENGFKERKDAIVLCQAFGTLAADNGGNKDLFPYTGNKAVIEKAERKKEKIMIDIVALLLTHPADSTGLGEKMQSLRASAKEDVRHANRKHHRSKVN